MPEEHLKRRLYQKIQGMAQLEAVNWGQIRSQLQEVATLLETDLTSPAAQESILQRRARQVAEIPAEPMRTENFLPVVVVKLGQERYAVPVSAVRAIVEIKHLTPVPCVPPFYCGIMNVNGKLTSVLDLLVLFGVAGTSLPVNQANRRRMAVIITGANLEIGLIVDEIEAVTDLPTQTLTGAQALGPEWLEAVGAVTTDGIILLDIEQLLRDSRLRIYEESR